MQTSENNKRVKKNKNGNDKSLLCPLLIGRQFSHTSPRTLLAVIRMAQAIARLHFRHIVEISDVDEALRLIKAAKASLDDHAGPAHRDTSKTTQIWEIMKQMQNTADSDSLDIANVRRRVTGRGFTEDEMWNTIREYSDYGVIFTSDENRRLTFVEIGEDMEID